jgi:hypothetical protein
MIEYLPLVAVVGTMIYTMIDDFYEEIRELYSPVAM